MHWYEGIRADFYEQLLSEIKIPSRTNPRKRAWKARTDRRNEALDCTVYAVYLSRHLRLHLRRPGQWDQEELRQRQQALLPSDDSPPPAPKAAVQTPAPSRPPEAPIPVALPVPPAISPSGAINLSGWRRGGG